MWFPQLANVSKYRVTLRLLGELIIGGVFPKLSEGIRLLGTILSNIVNCDKESHVYVQVISSFARHCGEDFAGFTSRKQRLMAEKHKVVFPKFGLVPAEDQAAIHQQLLTYYKSLANHLLKAHKDLQNREKQNRHTLLVHVIEGLWGKNVPLVNWFLLFLLFPKNQGDIFARLCNQCYYFHSYLAILFSEMANA